MDGGMAGQCAPAAQVALVDNGNAPVATCQLGRPTRNGNSTATAYCDVSEAVTDGRPFILVAGSGQPYSAILLTDKSVTIVGPRVAPVARLFSVAMPSVNVTVNTGTRQVVLDGLDLGNDNVTRSLRGLACTNNAGAASNAAVILRNSRAHDSANEGVLATTCALTLDANIIESNGGGGVSASGGVLTLDASTVSSNNGAGVTVSGSNNYTITNNFIASNGTSAGNPGINIGDSGSTGTIAFDTLSKNGGLNTVEGGVVCPAAGANKVIQDSIVINNSSNAGTQFAGKCQLQNVVTGTDSFAGATMLTPSFVGANDFHLVASAAANLSCCIDKVGAPGTPNADHDVDETTRPKGTGATPYDIGAHEVQ
jgi:hypothetical protein